MKQKVWIGIDPGKNGCIAALYEKGTEVTAQQIPLIARENDIPQLVKVLEEWADSNKFDVHIVLEDVHAIFGSAAGATFEFGRGLGIIEGIIASKEIPHTKVQPKVWQKLCFQGVPEIRKPASEKQKAAGRQGKTNTKAMALLAVKRLFPTIKLTFGKAQKPHEGFVDALLMAYYCKQTFNR